MTNHILQWAGTSCLLAMYVIMNFFPELHPWQIIAGCAGGLLYFTWSYRTSNKPQMIVNAAGVLVCVAGLTKFFL